MSPGRLRGSDQGGHRLVRLPRPGHDARAPWLPVGREGMALRARAGAAASCRSSRRSTRRTPTPSSTCSAPAAGLDAEDSDLRLRPLLEALRRRAAEPVPGDPLAVPRRQFCRQTSSTRRANSAGSSTPFSIRPGKNPSGKTSCCTAPADSARPRSRSALPRPGRVRRLRRRRSVGHARRTTGHRAGARAALRRTDRRTARLQTKDDAMFEVAKKL